MDRVKFQRYDSHGLLLFINLTHTHGTPSVCTAEPRFQYLDFDFFRVSITFTYNFNLFLNRIYQFASLNYTKKATSIKPGTSQFHEMGGGSSHMLLNLDPENVVFYVGGYPPDFRVSVNVFSLSKNIYIALWHKDLRSLFQLSIIYKMDFTIYS